MCFVVVVVVVVAKQILVGHLLRIMRPVRLSSLVHPSALSFSICIVVTNCVLFSGCV